VNEHDERFPRGERGVQGEDGMQGEKGDRGERGMQGLRGLPTATRRAIVFLFLLAVFFGAFNAFWNSHNVGRAAAAQRAEQRQFEAGQRASQAAARQAQLKASVPVCMALLKLSEIHGSHGTTSATYGIHLETGLKNVYKSSGCPKVLELAGTPAPTTP
jgi:hypothetical protein